MPQQQDHPLVDKETGNDTSPGHLPVAIAAEQIKAFRHCVSKFNSVPTAMLRRKLTRWWYVGCAALVVILALVGSWEFSLAMVAFAGVCSLGDLLISGMSGKSVLLSKVIRFVLEGRPLDWALIGIGTGTGCIVLVTLDLVGVALGILLVGLSLIVAVHWILDKQVSDQQRRLIESIEQLLLSLRSSGAEEQQIRQFACQHAGEDWEPCFETLFGYDALIEARRRWGLDELGRPRRQRYALRDRIVKWLDERSTVHRDRIAAYTRPGPSETELKSPMPASSPRNQQPAPTHTVGQSNQAPPSIRAHTSLRREIERSIRPQHCLIVILFGTHLRLIVGAMLVVGCVAWMVQNNLVPGQDIQDLQGQVYDQKSQIDIEQLTAELLERANPTNKPIQPLHLAWLPHPLTGWINSYHVGLAGLMLVISSLFRSILIGMFVYPAIAVMMFGHHWGIGSFWGVPQYLMSIVAGLALMIVGISGHLFVRSSGEMIGLSKVSESHLSLLNARGETIHRALGPKKHRDTKTLQFFRAILTTSLRVRASDVHFESEPEGGSIRMRVDGTMVEVKHIDQDLFPRLLRLVKILCDLDITKRRIVQEGHFSATTPMRKVDFRVSFTPAIHGQKLAIRVLDAIAVPQHSTDLQMPGWMHRQLHSFCGRDSGMLLACGPTGSGKTTTLYAVVRNLDLKQRNVMTIEDPVEYELEDVTQIQTNEQAGNTFHSLLRSTLRQDPDVILLGEIRDSETAHTAIQAAMTGHLVLSSLHARDAAGTIIRLLGLGVEPDMLVSSLNLVFVQRLIRTLCKHCKVSHKPNAFHVEKMRAHGKDMSRVYYPRGCSKCLNSGYHGRQALFELLVVDEPIKEAILSGPTVASLHAAMRHAGFVSVAEMGWHAVAEGTTSVDEVIRVIHAFDGQSSKRN